MNPVIDLEPVRPGRAGTPHRPTWSPQVELRDRHCVFPWCARPAKKCDKDHVVPYGRDGVTCACNLAPLCRRHHRHKTHGRWRYLALKPGDVPVDQAHGYRYLVDEEGTEDVSPDRRSRSRHGRRATYSTTEEHVRCPAPAPPPPGE